MFNDLPDKIYEAAFVPEMWPEVLEAAAWLSDSASGAVFLFSDGSPVRGKALANVQPVFDEFVSGEIWKSSDSVQSVYRSQPAGFVQVDDLLTAEQIANDPIRKRLRSIGIGTNLSTAIPMPSGEVVTFVFQRWVKDGGYHQAAINRMDDIRPHLARAGLIAARLGLERAQMAVSTLEAIGLPAAILAGSGKLLAANELFDGLASLFRPAAFERLLLADPSIDALFKQSVADATSGNLRIGSIPVPALADRPPLVIHVLPVRGAVHDIFSGAQVLIVVTAVKATGGVLPASILHALFDLTPAEARLAKALASGKSMLEAATEAGTKINTARSHLDQIFQKTGTHRQSELVALLKSTAPIGG